MAGLSRAVALLIAGSTATATYAQNKDALRQNAAAAAVKLRSLGEPKDRCAIGAFVIDGPTIVRTTSTTPLKPGDRLLSLNGTDLSGMKAESVVEILRATEKTTSLAAKVERAGSRLDLNLTCTNARAMSTALLAALDAASDSKFDDCATLMEGRSELGASGANLRLQCAANSRNKKRYDIGQLAYEAMRLQVEDAAWAPSTQAGVVANLRGTEGLISQDGRAARYQELVAMTAQWKGGAGAYAESEPDWQRFRASAENAVTARLIDPESARIDWPHGFLYGTWKPVLEKRVEGYWTCGLINARNRLGGYTGSTFFVVVLDRQGGVKYLELGTGKDYDFLSSQCQNSVKLLPAAPAAFSIRRTDSSAAPLSIADEIKKLAELHSSGALSDSEFQIAKAKLLSSQPK